MRTGTDQLSGLNFSDLKSSTMNEQELPAWGDVNVLLATADGRVPETVKSMQWRIASWPLASVEEPKKTWKHLIERLRRGGLA
jgi:hypothetical protein